MKLVYIGLLVLVTLSSANIVANVYDQLKYNSIIDALVKVVDKNSDGKITAEDLEEVVGSFGDVPVDAIIGKLDKNNDKAVDHTDLKIEVEKLSDAIVGMYDFDDNGYLTKNEVNYSNDVTFATTGKGLEFYFTFMFDVADLNADGIISDSDFPKLAPFQKMKIFLTKDTNFIATYQYFEYAPLLIVKLASELLKAIDVNEDYQINKGELTQFLIETMDKLDQNDDGAVKIKEVFETMEEFKFPERFVQQSEQIHDTYSKILNHLFNNVDIDADGRINPDELSKAFTKPMSSSYLEEIQQSYMRPSFNYVEDINEEDMRVEDLKFSEDFNATFASVSSFLRSSNSAASINISFILTCFAFVCSVLIN